MNRIIYLLPDVQQALHDGALDGYETVGACEEDSISANHISDAIVRLFMSYIDWISLDYSQKLLRFVFLEPDRAFTGFVESMHTEKKSIFFEGQGVSAKYSKGAFTNARLYYFVDEGNEDEEDNNNNEVFDAISDLISSGESFVSLGKSLIFSSSFLDYSDIECLSDYTGDDEDYKRENSSRVCNIYRTEDGVLLQDAEFGSEGMPFFILIKDEQLEEMGII